MTNKLQLGRRNALAMLTGAAIATTAGAPAEAADVALSCWTGYPELVPWYKERGDAYAKDHPGFSLELAFDHVAGARAEAGRRHADRYRA